ncbi:MAG: DUF433 domain-containing protein, partial [Microcystaceae cyanobacterium]
MTIKQLETQLLNLSLSEKAQIINILAHSLNQNWRVISKNRGVCGGDACIAGTRIPIWVLVNARNLGISESQLLYDYPTLTATDLANAWIYAQANPDEIAIAIRENEED